jgi:mono/diheme cytochrome c family protein
MRLECGAPVAYTFARRRSTVAKSLIIAQAAAVAMLLGACKAKPRTPAQVGRVIYMTNCVVCHNPDPNLPGSQGPAIAGSSRELIEARVVHLTYPPGYKPKRTTHAMRAFPQFADKIDDLTAFLAEAAKNHRE